MTIRLKTPAELRNHVGEELGTSDWVLIDQEHVDMFAEATGDQQWIHVDTERAAAGPFGGTIAHGYLTLALAPMFLQSILTIDTYDEFLNYGVNRVRFTGPVPVGSRVRATLSLVGVEERAPAALESTFAFHYSVEGRERPACVAETVYLFR